MGELQENQNNNSTNRSMLWKRSVKSFDKFKVVMLLVWSYKVFRHTCFLYFYLSKNYTAHQTLVKRFVFKIYPSHGLSNNKMEWFFLHTWNLCINSTFKHIGLIFQHLEETFKVSNFCNIFQTDHLYIFSNC